MTRIQSLSRRAALGMAAGLLAIPGNGRAQGGFPNRSLRFVSTGTPGSISDIMPRVLSPELEKGLGQPVVVENRAGGSGLVGASAAMASPADGYTLFLGSVGTMTVNPFVLPKMPFDAERDFRGIGLVATMPLVLVVSPERRDLHTLDGLIAAAKREPGALSFGTVGPGSTSNIIMAVLSRDEKVDLIPVAYAGYSAAVSEIVAGRLTCMFADFGTAIGQIQQGLLKPVALSTAQRAPLLPEVPTMKELGRDIDMGLWYGAYVRSATPAEPTQRLTAEIRRAVLSPSVQERFRNYGLQPGEIFGEDFQAFHLAELRRWARTIPELGIQVPS
jgi:tripartite-type tricarboxylate transporter receptor subunit TctC